MNNKYFMLILYFFTFVFPGVLSMKAEESEQRSGQKKTENDNQIAAAATV